MAKAIEFLLTAILSPFALVAVLVFVLGGLKVLVPIAIFGAPCLWFWVRERMEGRDPWDRVPPS